MKLAPRSAVLTAGALLALSAAMPAEAYPERPVSMVVAFAPGGATDIVARMMAQELGERWAHPMVVENRGGAGTIIATELVANEAPDGHTLLFTSAAFAINPALRAGLPYDSLVDLTPVTQATSGGSILIVHPDVPAQSMEELIAYAEANPGELSFGSSGIGASNHLAGELLKLLADVDIVHVPFAGTGDAMTSLLSGEIDMLFDSLVSGLSQTRAGTVRALGVTSVERSAGAPDLPAIGEIVDGFRVDSWLGIFAPAGVADDLLATIHEELAWALNRPAVVERLADVGTNVVASKPEEFRAYIEEQMAVWAEVIEAAGIERQ